MSNEKKLRRWSLHFVVRSSLFNIPRFITGVCVMYRERSQRRRPGRTRLPELVPSLVLRVVELDEAVDEFFVHFVGDRVDRDAFGCGLSGFR
jgi:hypothetical protein